MKPEIVRFNSKLSSSDSRPLKVTENNAHEIMLGAERDYTEYAREMVKVSDRNVLVVEGTLK